MKTVLCISPNFPPVNAPDMQRLRQSVSYFKEFNWRPVIFTVDPYYVEQTQDELLLESIPEDIEVHKVKAFSTKWTRKIALGNLGFRSWFQYRCAVDSYIRQHKVDLIYFSTTVFTLMPLGLHWKKKFNIPFIVDLQDPWRNDYYLTLPKNSRPKKFWFDYIQKKYLEAKTMPKVDGIVSVSDGYVDTMKSRYSSLISKKSLTLPFSALDIDIEIARKQKPALLDENFINITYIGRGGKDMEFSLTALFNGFKRGLDKELDNFQNIRFSFYGTSYAADGLGEKTIMPIAKKCGIELYVNEFTDRLPYFKSLSTLMQSDILFIPGSVDSNYTASKIFPYIMMKKPLFAIFNRQSSIVEILQKTKGGEIISFEDGSKLKNVTNDVLVVLEKIVKKIPYKPDVIEDEFNLYSAREMTKQQCHYFDHVVG